MRHYVVHECGDASVLQLNEAEMPSVSAGHVRIRVHAAGFNFIDIMKRSGRFPGPIETPFTPGQEVVGTIDAIGSGVCDVKAGSRVVANLELGGYAEYVIAAADRIFVVPDEINDHDALALGGTQGQTAFGVTQSLKKPDGRPIFISAACGGVGSLLVQICKNRGWSVIAGVSSDEKELLARELGSIDVIRYDRIGWENELQSLVGPSGGLAAALDSVGGDIYRGAFAALGNNAEIVFYGVASGEPVGMPAELAFNAIVRCQAARGFGLIGYFNNDPAILRHTIESMFEAASSGAFGSIRTTEFSFEEAATAHRAVEERRTTGKVLLTMTN
ncbi:MAG: zinc-binding dehydrogenase [Planctomycetota bacterium]